MSGWLKSTELGVNMREGILNTNVEIGEFPLATPQSYSSGTAIGYRLVKEPNGELTLQGAYSWWSAQSAGFEWRDIATVNREDISEDAQPTQH